MAANYGQHVRLAIRPNGIDSTLKTPVNEKARADQVVNSDGGYVFAIDKWQRLERWLILGAEGGTFYASEKKLTKENALTIMECLAENGLRTVEKIVDVSDRGLAPKNDPAIFALAMAAGSPDEATRAVALQAVPKVCRIGTHLFHFARDVESFRGWGRGLRRAIARWYTQRPVESLERDVCKYRQRDGWSHRDLLRLSHPQAQEPARATLLRHVAGAELGERKVSRLTPQAQGGPTTVEKTYGAVGGLSDFVLAFEEAQKVTDRRRLIELIEKHDLTHEMIPSQWKSDKDVWGALLVKMPIGALVRNLGKMTEVGLLTPMSGPSKMVAEKLANAAAIKKARLHPLNTLVALRTYSQGHGDKGKLTWQPVRQVIGALDAAFYLSFDAVEPTGKNRVIALDISGSMGSDHVAGMPITPREATAAWAMVAARTEKNWICVGFSHELIHLDISPTQRLDDVLQKISNLPFGSTNCSLPITWALSAGVNEIDSFEVMTDNEINIGRIHPFQALKQYRQKSGRAAKMTVMATTSTGFTIADPCDAGMMDVVGLSPDVPAVVANFIRGSAENALEKARALLLEPNPTLERAREITAELEAAGLKDIDAFWGRWDFFVKKLEGKR